MGDSMSTIINATTTNGVVIQPDNSGSLELQTNSGTTALTIDTSQRVGIGTASPAYKFTVQDAAGATRANIINSANSANGSGVFLEVYDGATQKSGITLRTDNADNFGILNKTDDVQLNLTSTGLLQFNSGYGSAATAYGCRAWVNFNGTGTVAIRGSGNVSSITDNGSGNYTVNFTTAIVDVNYSANVTLQRENTSVNYANVYGSFSTDTFSTTAFQIRSMFINDTASGYTDSLRVSVCVFR
jgi:hypothetical protein